MPVTIAPSGTDLTPRFVSGSLMRHVVVMAGTGAIGLVAIFAVDLLNFFYLAMLGDQSITAAIGFTGAVSFFQTSVCIGLVIGIGAVVSRTIGAGRPDDARRIAAASLAMMLAVTGLIGAATVLLLHPILGALGAAGAVRDQAAIFLTIVAPTTPLLAAGMALSTLLRSAGDAKRALNVTLFAAIAAAAFDPILIFALHLGLTGAAISTVLSRIVLAWIGYRGAVSRHHMIGRLDVSRILPDLRQVLAVSGPAILTNLATPVASAYVTRSMAVFGPAAIAGQASIDRMAPVAFGVVFALTGAVGPILAQNLGAGRVDRVRDGLRASLLFVACAVSVAWAVLFAAQDIYVRILGASGETASLIHLFCTYLAGSFLFTGALFVANAAFNNLGFPLLSTLFNWGRATLGTIPLVMLGKPWGAPGVMIGAAGGSFVFGVSAAVTAFVVIGRLKPGAKAPQQTGMAIATGSGKAALASLTTAPPASEKITQAPI